MTDNPIAAIASISIVIPVYNERDSLVELYQRLLQVQATLPSLDFQILFVDDGSTDGSGTVLNSLVDRDEQVEVLRFRRNFGKAAALAAGFELVRGDVIITMDADLQDRPEEIPRFIEALEKGGDMVVGWKLPRHDPLTKRLPSKLFNHVVCWTTGIRLHDMNCGFKAFRREIVPHLHLYGELHRYLPVMAHSYGFRLEELAVTHAPRRFGKSKYGVWRLLSGFFDLFTVLTLTRFRASPLHMFGMVGFSVSLIGGGVTIYLLIARLMGEYLSNRPLFFFGLALLMIGAQVVFFGLLAEMIASSRDASSHYAIREHRCSRPDHEQETSAMSLLSNRNTSP